MFIEEAMAFDELSGISRSINPRKWAECMQDMRKYGQNMHKI
jgi:hypothetical protein